MNALSTRYGEIEFVLMIKCTIIFKAIYFKTYWLYEINVA